jgi:cell division protein FtsI (penicillin-binding protein 3)
MGETRPTEFPRRRQLVVAVLALATLGLAGRAVDLQVNHHEFLRGEGDARHVRLVKAPGYRGKILDRAGEPLAVSAPVDSVWANPAELAEQEARTGELADLLGLDLRSLRRMLLERRDREFVYLRRHVGPGLARQVTDLDVPGVYLKREYRRFYPLGETAAHVVGFTNVDDVGQEGVELAYDARLRGVAGRKRVIRDRFGRAVEDVDRIAEPRPGRDLALSIDGRIQYLAYRALMAGVRKHGARAGSAMVLDVRTGEVLAMVNHPANNPNNRADRITSKLRNRAMTDVFEPGSIIKPFTIAAALETGRYRPDTPVDTRPGLVKVGSHTIKDPRDYGVIDVATVIKKSSNVGATKLSLSLDPKTLWTTFTRVGLGVTTGSGFPGESEGVLTHFFEWGDVHRATLSFGYGLSVTSAQLAQAYAVIANGGLLPRLTFERGSSSRGWVRVMSADTARQLRRMLELVVGPGGTGSRARVPGYRVGGKTGTVRKSVAGGYSEDRYLALFAGMAPLSLPRVVVVVWVDEPAGEAYYGGQVAAPIFSEIVSGSLRVLGVAPDDLGLVKHRVALTRETPPAPRPSVYARAGGPEAPEATR